MSTPDRTLLEDGERLLGPGRRPLTGEQDAVVRERDGALMVAAGAGSGKTTVLVERFVRYVVDDGIDPGGILAITFTRRAAGELRHRIRERFKELGCAGHARAVEGGWISTIDGFCARVLRAHAVVAGIDPEFTILEPAELRVLRERAWDVALAELLQPAAGGLPSPDAEHLVTVYGYDSLRELVCEVYDDRRSAGQGDPRLPRVPDPDLPRLAAELRDSARALAAELAPVRSTTLLDRARERVAACLDAIETWSAVPASPAALKAVECPRRDGMPELSTPACTAYRDALAAYGQGCADARARPILACLNALLMGYGRAFAAAKRARAGLDYTDLAITTRDLFVARPDLGAAYRERLQRVMVDEFQDTNGLQRDLLRALGQTNLFTVGDRLQSIYSFRHADVGVFLDLWDEREAEGRARRLATNFRSRPEILELINAAWGTAHGADSADLQPGRAAAGGPRVELLLTDAPAWDALEADDPVAVAAGSGLPPAPARTWSEARLVARRVAALVAAGGGYAPGDVVVLLRSGTNMAVYERALEQERIPAVATQGRGWWTRQEVQDLLNHLRVVVNPLDEAAAFGALAAPFAGLRADALAALAGVRRRAGVSLWEIVEREAQEPAVVPLVDGDRARLAAYRGLVAGERSAAAWASPGELLERAVARTGYDVDVLGRPGGARRLANVRKLVRLAHAFEARSGGDLRAFVDFAAAEVEAGEPTPDAPIDLGADEAVRLMTVHGAKGLEFGVVVLADLGRDLFSDAPDVIVRGGEVGLRIARLEGASETAFAYCRLDEERKDRELAEEKRIVHVAVTRARELLILSGAYDPECWPAQGHRRPHLSWMGPGISAIPPAPGEPPGSLLVERGGWRAVVSPVVSAPARAVAVLGLSPADRPGTGGPGPDSPPPPPSPAPPEMAPAPVPAPDTISYTSLTDYRRCSYSWYLRRVLGLPRRDAGELAAAQPPGWGDDALMRGSIAHAVLEHAALAADAQPIDAAAIASAAAALGAEIDDERVADQLALAAGFLEGPFRARAAAAADVRREAQFAFPLSSADPASPLVNGVIDLLVLDDDGTGLVVDYKTDRIAPDQDPEALVARDYAIQRAIYALAVLRSGRSAVDVVHLYLSRPAEPAQRRYTTADIPELEARLAAAAGPLLAGEFPVTDTPHAALCGTCPGRGGMCPWPAEMTDRVLEVAEPAG